MRQFYYALCFIALAVLASSSFADDSLSSVSDTKTVFPIPAETIASTSVGPIQLPSNSGHGIKSIALKTVMGAGFGTFGLLIGAGLGMGIENTFFKSDGFLKGIEGFVIGGSIGYLLAEPVGIYLGGDIYNEHGSYWGALLGNVLGCALGIGLVALTEPKNDWVSTGIIISFPITGSILGYHHLFKPRR
jgi:hypothetical protein